MTLGWAFLSLSFPCSDGGVLWEGFRGECSCVLGGQEQTFPCSQSSGGTPGSLQPPLSTRGQVVIWRGSYG